MARSRSSRVSTGPVALTDVTIISGTPSTASSDSHATASPPTRCASSAARSNERLMTRKFPIPRLRMCSTTCTATAPALAHFQRALKNAIEHRAGGAMIERLIVSRPQLPQNFRFAQKHGIQARSDAKQMAHRVRPSPTIKTALQLVVRNFMERSEIFFHRFRGGWREIPRHAVKFAAIAGGDDHALFQNSAFLQFIGGLQSLLRSKSNPLAQFHWRGAMIAANQRHLNADRAGAVRVCGGRHQRNR